MRLSDSGQARVGSEYTKAAYGLFPRYRLDEAIEIDLLTEGAGLVVVLEDPAKSEHVHPFGLQWG